MSVIPPTGQLAVVASTATGFPHVGIVFVLDTTALDPEHTLRVAAQTVCGLGVRHATVQVTTQWPELAWERGGMCRDPIVEVFNRSLASRLGGGTCERGGSKRTIQSDACWTEHAMQLDVGVVQLGWTSNCAAAQLVFDPKAPWKTTCAARGAVRSRGVKVHLTHELVDLGPRLSSAFEGLSAADAARDEGAQRMAGTLAAWMRSGNASA